jgi:hypothetical protein
MNSNYATRLAAIATTVLALSACGASATGRGAGPSQIEAAAKDCKTAQSVQDNGRTISFDTKGDKDSTGDDIIPVACVLTKLKMPQSLVDRIDHTRALDGTQSGDWDQYHATWSYHPDSGMFLVIEEKP